MSIKYFKYKFTNLQTDSAIIPTEDLYAEGYRQGYQDAIRVTNDNQISLKNKLEAKLAVYLENCDQISQNISVIIARAIYKVLVGIYPVLGNRFKETNLLYVIQNNLDQFLDIEKIKIYVNPEDMKSLNNIFQEIKIVQDSNIGIGDCIITDGAKNMEVAVEKYLANINNILEKLILEHIMSYTQTKE